jgi:hypothetical protein
MATTLVVEDGTGVDGANSYVEVEEVRAYAALRGLVLPTLDTQLEPLVVRAMDYLESKRASYKGSKVNEGSEYLQWPRQYVYVDGVELGIDTIPRELKYAQCQLAFELQTVDPHRTTSGQVIRKEQVSSVVTEYAVNYKAERELPAYLPKVDVLLAPLLKTTAGLTVTRT